jgi:enterochelin esterase-like enzyme
MRSHPRFIVLAGAAVFALGLYASRPLEAQRGTGPASRPASLEAAVTEVEAGRRTTPLIGEPTAGGDATVTFLARRSGGRAPRVVSDVTGWGEHTDGTFDFAAGRMTRVGRTDWHSLQATVAPRARIEYLIAYTPTDYRIDPHNPRRAAGPQLGGARASEFVMPGYVPPQEFADAPSSPAGLLADAAVESRALRGSRRIIVYTPPGYRDDGHYPVAVFLDLRSAQVSRVLDWRIAHGDIDPIVAVFVDPLGLGDDSRPGTPMRSFVTDELLTWLAARYSITNRAGRRAIIGISFGAKDALGLALGCGGTPGAPLDVSHVGLGAGPGSAGLSGCQSDAFGRLGLLIPGRRIGRADIDAIAERPNHQLGVAILAGRYDHANVETARSLRRALADAGHIVDYTEVPEGHSAVTWTNHVGELLVSLFGPASANAALRRLLAQSEVEPPAVFDLPRLQLPFRNTRFALDPGGSLGIFPVASERRSAGEPLDR